MSLRKGSCLCGEVQVTVQGDPEAVVLCHCSDCSKNAGAPYQMVSLLAPLLQNTTYLQTVSEVSEIQRSNHERRRKYWKLHYH
jgi:hypothetical protein